MKDGKSLKTKKYEYYFCYRMTETGEIKLTIVKTHKNIKGKPIE